MSYSVWEKLDEKFILGIATPADVTNTVASAEEVVGQSQKVFPEGLGTFDGEALSRIVLLFLAAPMRWGQITTVLFRVLSPSWSSNRSFVLLFLIFLTVLCSTCLRYRRLRLCC